MCQIHTVMLYSTTSDVTLYDDLLMIFIPLRLSRLEKCSRLQYLRRRESVLFKAVFATKSKGGD